MTPEEREEQAREADNVLRIPSVAWIIAVVFWGAVFALVA